MYVILNDFSTHRNFSDLKLILRMHRTCTVLLPLADKAFSVAPVCNASEFWNRLTLAQPCEMKRGSRVWNHFHALNVTQHCIFMWRCLSRDGITRPVSVVQPLRPGETISSRWISVGNMHSWRHYEVRRFGYLPLISDNIGAEAEAVVFNLKLGYIVF
jgi:hypothetical protein